jgi:predicted nucleic acid-binding protein
MISNSEPVAITGVVVAEILQGLTRNVDEVEHSLSLWDLIEPLGFSTYQKAAAIFRTGRSKGIALTTIDTLIASIAIDHDATVFTLDKDFARIAQVTKLPLHQIP